MFTYCNLLFKITDSLTIKIGPTIDNPLKLLELERNRKVKSKRNKRNNKHS